MAGESIIVVDDSVVSLKLSATILRSEGYRVQLASNAEQALMMMRTTIPELLLLDLQLPGMSGLELARQLRQDARTRELLIVALTASAAAEAEQLAYDAGCDGFISKPVDTRSLGARLRYFLDGQSMPSPASAASPGSRALPSGLSFAGSEMEALRRSFLADGARHVRRMMEFIHARFDIGEATRMFHQWVGSAGALGYLELAAQARAAELLLTTPGWTPAEFRETLDALAVAFASPREAGDTAIPDAIMQELSRKRVALIGFADEEAERICEAFQRAGALPRAFTGEEPPQADSIRDCSVLMVHVRPETRGIPWLQADFQTTQPLVLVGGREDLLALPPAVQSRACEYLIDGWQTEEVIMRLSFALSRGAARQGVSATGRSTGKPQILIADDDANVRAVVRSALESLGMECHAADNGIDAIALVQERRPQVAVLDVNMPGVDGFGVLSAIRQAGLPVKVIMLTARQQERDVLRGFDLGADDYVVKPFNPMELAARLKRFL
ncbi:MAG: response regulator [Candidatus Solibacter sp.]